MSISPFHGGLVFRDSLIDSSYPTHIENVKTKLKEAVDKSDSAESGKESDDLNSRNLNEFFNPNVTTLPLQERYDLCAAVGEDIVKDTELMDLLKRKQMFNCYDGFEPSGRMHIAQGIMKAINVNRIVKAGGVATFWIADWFARSKGRLVKVMNRRTPDQWIVRSD